MRSGKIADVGGSPRTSEASIGRQCLGCRSIEERKRSERAAKRVCELGVR